MNTEDDMASDQEEMQVGSGSDSDSDSGDDDEVNEGKERELRAKVEEIRKQLDGNETYYDGHVGLISALRALLELEEARRAREAMSRVYPLTPELWLEWIKDEQKICTTAEERQSIIQLFDRAVQDYTSVQVWVEYVMFMVGGGDHEATRAVSDRALTAVGTHVAEGVLVWQVVLLVEKQIYSSLQKPGSVLSEAEQKTSTKQLQRLQQLYRRVVRVPLLNAEYEQLLEEAAEVFEEPDTYMKADLEKTQDRLADKMDFEEKLLQSKDLATYRQYIAAVVERDNPAAVQSLYERAVLDHCLDASLWEEYVKYVMQQFPGLDYVVLPVCERSQRNCPWSGALCELRITALQLFTPSDDKTLVSKLKGVLEKGLSSVQFGADATRMWMSYLVFLRRRVHWDQDHTQDLEVLRDNAHQAITMIDASFGEEGDLESEIPRWLARVEAELARDVDRARAVWNDVIMKRNNNFKNANLWLEFINLERSFGSEKHCRKLLRRALERVWDWVESVGAAFLRFEQEVGTLDTMMEFTRRYDDRMAIVNKRRAEESAKEEAQTRAQPGRKQKEKGKKQHKRQEFVPPQENKHFKAPHPVSKGKSDNQRRHGEGQNGSGGGGNGTSTPDVPPPPGFKDTQPLVSPPPGFKDSVPPPPGYKDTVPPPPGFKESVASPPGFKESVAPPPGFKESVAPPPGFKGDVSPPPGFNKAVKRKSDDPAEDEHATKRLREAELYGVRVSDDTDDDLNTVFISNLDFSVGESEVCPVFAGCGQVKEFRLVKDFKCRSKGFGYLVFTSHTAAVNALKYDRTPIGGRPMFVSRYDPAGGHKEFKYSTNLEREKLFIRGLPFHYTEKDIKNLFSPHGDIKDMRLVTYRNGHSKGLCFIEYHDAATAEKVLNAMDGTTVEDKEISVMISNPSEKKKPREARPDTEPDHRGQQRPGQERAAQEPRRKPAMSLMPRALMRAKVPAKDAKQPATPIESTTATEPAAPKSNDDFRKMFLK